MLRFANAAFLGDFLCSGVPRVAPYCVLGGIRVVSIPATAAPRSCTSKEHAPKVRPASHRARQHPANSRALQSLDALDGPQHRRWDGRNIRPVATFSDRRKATQETCVIRSHSRTGSGAFTSAHTEPAPQHMYEECRPPGMDAPRMEPCGSEAAIHARSCMGERRKTPLLGNFAHKGQMGGGRCLLPYGPHYAAVDQTTR